MRIRAPLILAIGAVAFGATAPSLRAQSTDGYHTVLVVPLVVKTASYTQRITIHNPYDLNATLTGRFYAAEGTSKPPGGSCITSPHLYRRNSALTVTFDGCSDAPPGSQFGFLMVRSLEYPNEPPGLPPPPPISMYSRAETPAGIGFSVEGFPASAFTSADSSVTGLHRAGASGTRPAYQTNCFIANLGEISPTGTPVPTPVLFTVYEHMDQDWPVEPTTFPVATGEVVVAPGQMIRLLDVFAAAGAPAGDFYNASVKFEEMGPGEPGIMTFCTVQENTNFSADFRIGKQVASPGGLAYPPGRIYGAMDYLASRETRTNTDATDRPFVVPPGDFANTHVVYFRHPDYIRCNLVTSLPSGQLPPEYGLEFRMLDESGSVVAGGDGVTRFDYIYLGDKAQRNGGANGRYLIEVEDSETASGAIRPYALHCESGSGHTLGDLVKYQEPADRF